MAVPVSVFGGGVGGDPGAHFVAGRQEPAWILWPIHRVTVGFVDLAQDMFAFRKIAGTSLTYANRGHVLNLDIDDPTAAATTHAC